MKDVKEGGISARKAGQMWGLSIKKLTLQARLNRRVTFDRRIDGPSPVFFSFLKQKMKKRKKKANCKAWKPRLWLVHG